MSLTDEQTRIAAAIADEFHRLLRQGKSQATILALMHHHMPRFKALMDVGVIQEQGDSIHRMDGRGESDSAGRWQSLGGRSWGACENVLRRFRIIGH